MLLAFEDVAQDLRMLHTNFSMLQQHVETPRGPPRLYTPRRMLMSSADGETDYY